MTLERARELAARVPVGTFLMTEWRKRGAARSGPYFFAQVRGEKVYVGNAQAAEELRDAWALIEREIAALEEPELRRRRRWEKSAAARQVAELRELLAPKRGGPRGGPRGTVVPLLGVCR